MQSIEFPGGKDDFAGASEQAQKCPEFRLDSSDEWVTDEILSCYNCKHRRWTMQSFTCLKDHLTNP